jgi:hypothetical protein
MQKMQNKLLKNQLKSNYNCVRIVNVIMILRRVVNILPAYKAKEHGVDMKKHPKSISE